MLKEVNLKEVANVNASISILQMEVENSRREGVSVLKFIHGYGSGGRGGEILKELRKELLLLRKRGKIKDFFNGDKWNLFERVVVDALNRDKEIVGDNDLNTNNPGITIVILWGV